MATEAKLSKELTSYQPESRDNDWGEEEHRMLPGPDRGKALKGVAYGFQGHRVHLQETLYRREHILC